MALVTLLASSVDIATNNEAEYTGLIIGLQKAIEQGIQELEVYGDSNLVVNQVSGFWRLKVQLRIAKEWDGNDTYLAKVYRWYLRGLPPDMAVHKVRVDAPSRSKCHGQAPLD